MDNESKSIMYRTCSISLYQRAAVVAVAVMDRNGNLVVLSKAKSFDEGEAHAKKVVDAYLDAHENDD